MRRPAHLSLCIATTMMMIIGGARGVSRDLLLKIESPKDYEHSSVLKMFFEEMVRVIDNDKKWLPRHATILSLFAKDFDDAAPLCDNYSCFLGDRLDKFIGTPGFSQANIVVVFNHVLKSNLKDIRSCSKCFLLVVTRKPVSRKSLTEYYNREEAKKILYLAFIVVDGSMVKLYTPRATGDCRIEAKLLVRWKTGDAWPKNLKNFSGRIEILRGCTMRVKTRNEIPAMQVEDVGGTMTIMGGIEGQALLAATKALKMNLQVDLIKSQKTGSAHISPEQQIVDAVASGKADIGMGQLRSSAGLDTSNVAFDSTRRFETVVWCVPRILMFPANIMTFEFSRLTWILIFIVGVLMVCVTFVFHRVSGKNLEIERQRRNRRNVLITRENLSYLRKLAIRKKKPKGWGKTILDVFSMSLGYPVFVDPITTSARILLFTFLYYVLVMTTGYKASLSSVMTVGMEKPAITDVNGIIAANLTTGGGIAELKVLMDQMDESPTNRELIRRYVVYHNRTEAMNLLKSRHNFAHLTLLSRLYDEEGIEIVKNNPYYYVLPDPVLTYSSLVIAEKQSAVLYPLTMNMLRLHESGIIDYWQRLMYNAKRHRANSNHHDDKRRHRKRANLFKFAPIFASYLICMFISMLVFIGELLVHKCW